MSIVGPPINALPLTYRQTEMQTIARLLRAGESCSVVGVSGMAKSNLFRHLLAPDTRRHFLNGLWRDYFFIAADLNALGEFSERAVYDLLLDKIGAECRSRPCSRELASRLDDIYQQTRSTGDALPWQKAFTQSVNALMREDVGRHLVLLFDQFDEVCKKLNPKFFTNLRSIRDEHKYRVSYVVFTRDEMPRLCQAQEFEEFYELFSPNVVGLGPYEHADAHEMIARVGARYEQSLPDASCEQLIEISGGHPGLLRALTLVLLRESGSVATEPALAVDGLLEVRDIWTECNKLWHSLSDDEQNVVRHLANNTPLSIQNSELHKRLRLKKLVEEDLRLFSPLFSRYAAQQHPAHFSETLVQTGPIRIDTAGEVWVHGQQIIPALSRKEFTLLKYLCLNAGRLVTKDEVVAVVYPDEYKTGESVSDEALNRLVQRLREKISEWSKGHTYVITVRGKGYRLNTNS